MFEFRELVQLVLVVNMFDTAVVFLNGAEILLLDLILCVWGLEKVVLGTACQAAVFKSLPAYCVFPFLIYFMCRVEHGTARSSSD